MVIIFTVSLLHQIKTNNAMKTQEEIKSEMLSEELSNRQIENHFSVSHTDYGTSCYFTFFKNSESIDKLVIRISDHSVENQSRIENEVHRKANNIDIYKTANEVERYLYPERFKFEPTNKNFTHRINGIFGVFVKK